MSKVTKIGDTLPKNTPTSSVNPNFATDVIDVSFTLPVNSESKQIKIDLFLNRDVNGCNLFNYDFDYLPNVDVNAYLQYVVNLYNNGIEAYPPKSN